MRTSRVSPARGSRMRSRIGNASSNRPNASSASTRASAASVPRPPEGKRRSRSSKVVRAALASPAPRSSRNARARSCASSGKGCADNARGAVEPVDDLAAAPTFRAAGGTGPSPGLVTSSTSGSGGTVAGGAATRTLARAAAACAREPMRQSVRGPRYSRPLGPQSPDRRPQDHRGNRNRPSHPMGLLRPPNHRPVNPAGHIEIGWLGRALKAPERGADAILYGGATAALRPAFGFRT